MTSLIKTALMTILLLTSLLRTSPARAEFSTAFIAAGIVVGIAMAEMSHRNDKDCKDNQGDKSGEKE